MPPASQASPWGPFDSPPLIVTYGDSNMGKTFDLLRSFPTGLYLHPVGSLKPAVLELGYQPQGVPVHHIWDVGNQLENAVKLGYRSIIVDDASLLFDATAELLRPSIRDGRALYGKVLDLARNLRDRLRYLGVAAALNFHERPAFVNDAGQFERGGPRLPSRGGTRAFPPLADVVLRAARDPGRRPWTGIYQCDPDSLDWYMKDRHGVAPAEGPMNLGELLRASGVPMQRLPGLEWIDDSAEQLAQAVQADPTQRMAIAGQWAQHMLGQQVPLAHVRWLIQDGLDRAELRISRHAQIMEQLGLGPDGKPLPAGALTSASPTPAHSPGLPRIG